MNSKTGLAQKDSFLFIIPNYGEAYRQIHVFDTNATEDIEFCQEFYCVAKASVWLWYKNPERHLSARCYFHCFFQHPAIKSVCILIKFAQKSDN